MFSVQEVPHLPDGARPAVDNNPMVDGYCSARACGGKIVQNGTVCEYCGLSPMTGPVDINNEVEYRLHAGASAEENQDKIRLGKYTDEDDHDRCHFSPSEVPNPECRLVITRRLNQTMVWMRWLTIEESQPGHLALTPDEASTFRDVLRAACLAWAASSVADGAPKIGKDFGSPVFWAITIALEVVARRLGGFCVQTETQASLFTFEALHARLQDHQSHVQHTSEKLGNRTKAGGSAAAGSKVIGKTHKRKARFDPLGNEVEQTKKREALNRLILDSEVFGMAEMFGSRTGLSREVMEKRMPRVMAPFVVSRHMAAPIATEYLAVVAKKRVGLEADMHRAKQHRASSSATSAAPPEMRLGLTREEKQEEEDEAAKLAAALEFEMESSDDTDRVSSSTCADSGRAAKKKLKSTQRCISKSKLRKMSWMQAMHTPNYDYNGHATLKANWKPLHDAHVARELQAAADKLSRDTHNAAAQMRRDEGRELSYRVDMAKREVARKTKGYNQGVALIAKQETAERIASRGKPACFVASHENLADKETETIPVITIRNAKVDTSRAINKEDKALAKAKVRAKAKAKPRNDFFKVSIKISGLHIKIKCKEREAEDETDEDDALNKLPRLA